MLKLLAVLIWTMNFTSHKTPKQKWYEFLCFPGGLFVWFFCLFWSQFEGFGNLLSLEQVFFAWNQELSNRFFCKIPKLHVVSAFTSNKHMQRIKLVRMHLNNIFHYFQYFYQNTGSTTITLLHEKINPKNWQVLSLGDAGFLHCLRVVSSEYGKPRNISRY